MKIKDKDVKVYIQRFDHQEEQTLGTGMVFNDNNGVEFTFCTLELPWRNNERRVSCIPEGVYDAILHDSPKFGKSIWIQDVPNRTEVLVHFSNFVRDLLGCIAAGRSHIDIDGDGLKDVTSSRHTMKKIVAALPPKFKIQIDD